MEGDRQIGDGWIAERHGERHEADKKIEEEKENIEGREVKMGQGRETRKEKSSEAEGKRDGLG